MQHVAIISFNKTFTTLGQQIWPVIEALWRTVGWSNRSFPSLASITLKNFPVILFYFPKYPGFITIQAVVQMYHFPALN
jgi:hypothetical protein